MKRVRGSGGRFVNTKQQNSQPSSSKASWNDSCSDPCSCSGLVGLSATSTGSDMTTLSTSGRMLMQQDQSCYLEPGFLSSAAATSQGGGRKTGNGSDQRTPAVSGRPRKRSPLKHRGIWSNTQTREDDLQLRPSPPYPIADARDFSVNSDSSSDFLISVRGFYCLAFRFLCRLLASPLRITSPVGSTERKLRPSVRPSKEETHRERERCVWACMRAKDHVERWAMVGIRNGSEHGQPRGGDLSLHSSRCWGGETSTATSEQPRGHTEMCCASQDDALSELRACMHACICKLLRIHGEPRTMQSAVGIYLMWLSSH
ncbi:hypothetical protein BHE74_00037678 [Ensete ventricosum]|nr:hypothetical protein BHE74_00037678 [Ensete ventricosum]